MTAPASLDDTAGDAAGFADALQRASGSARAKPPSSADPGPSRAGRDAARESTAAPGSKRLRESVSRPRDEVDETSQGTGAEAAQDTDDEHADATIEHDTTAREPGGEAAALMTMPDAGAARPATVPGADGGSAAGRHPAGAGGAGKATPGEAAAPDALSKAQGMGTGMDPTAGKESPPEDATPAAPGTAETDGRTAGQQVIVPTPSRIQSAGTLRRSGAGAASLDTAGRGPVAGAALDGPAVDRVAATRASIGHATVVGGRDQPAAAVTFAESGGQPEFADALLAASAPDADPRAGVAASATPFQSAGGLRPIALPIAAPVHSPAFAQALGQQLAVALRMDLDQAELILSPAELGPVRVGLSLEGDTASVHFAAIHPETRQALEQSLPNLRALFAEQGLSLAHTHVGPGFHRDGEERPTHTMPHRAASGPSDTAIDGGIRPTSARIRPDALVDLFA